MRKIYVLIAIAIIGVLSWCTTVNATNNIVDLGTIHYSNTHEKVLTVIIEHNQSVDLAYISSDVDRSALYIDNYWFSPLDNETTYIFATKQIDVEWWFKNDTKSFIYQDNNTKQLYRINIDYSDIKIPPDPVFEWMDKYNTSVESFDELQGVFKTTLNDLNRTRENLEIRWLIYNQSKDEFHNKTLLAEKLQQELEELDIKYNDTKNLWTKATANESFYKSYYWSLHEKHTDLQQKHNDLSGIYPVYVFFAILGTGFAVAVFLKRKKILGLEEKSDIEIDRDTGYSPKARRIDKFTARVMDKVKPKNKQNPSSSSESEHNPNNPRTEYEHIMNDIHKEIDGIKQSHDVFQKSTVKDIQDIQRRVDFIETKFKTGKEMKT